MTIDNEKKRERVKKLSNYADAILSMPPPQDRIALAKLLKGTAEGKTEEAEALTSKAMEDVKLATLCLKYAAL